MEHHQHPFGNFPKPEGVKKEFPFFYVLEDDKIQFKGPGGLPPSLTIVPPCSDEKSGAPVLTKDVTISTSPPVSVRIFLPNQTPPDTKLPVLLYIHGGGFSMQSPFSAQYDKYVSSLVTNAKIIAVSVDYGLFPTRPIPACYDDSWAALNWVASHSEEGGGVDPWLNQYADFQRMFIGGDSAGGNITHTLTVRVGRFGLPGRAKVVGAVLSHPYFGGIQADDEMWMYMCPENEGPDDPRMKPAVEDLARIGCERVLVFVAEKDHLFGPGKAYYELLMKSGWSGTADLVENRGKQHCFHLFECDDEQAVSNMKRIVSFINGQ